MKNISKTIANNGLGAIENNKVINKSSNKYSYQDNSRNSGVSEYENFDNFNNYKIQISLHNHTTALNFQNFLLFLNKYKVTHKLEPDFEGMLMDAISALTHPGIYLEKIPVLPEEFNAYKELKQIAVEAEAEGTRPYIGHYFETLFFKYDIKEIFIPITHGYELMLSAWLLDIETSSVIFNKQRVATNFIDQFNLGDNIRELNMGAIHCSTYKSTTIINHLIKKNLYFDKILWDENLNIKEILNYNLVKFLDDLSKKYDEKDPIKLRNIFFKLLEKSMMAEEEKIVHYKKDNILMNPTFNKSAKKQYENLVEENELKWNKNQLEEVEALNKIHVEMAEVIIKSFNN